MTAAKPFISTQCCCRPALDHCLERVGDEGDVVVRELHDLIAELRVWTANAPRHRPVAAHRSSERARRVAARVRMNVDAQAGTVTPEWIRQLVGGRPDYEADRGGRTAAGPCPSSRLGVPTGQLVRIGLVTLAIVTAAIHLVRQGPLSEPRGTRGLAALSEFTVRQHARKARVEILEQLGRWVQVADLPPLHPAPRQRKLRGSSRAWVGTQRARGPGRASRA